MLRYVTGVQKEERLKKPFFFYDLLQTLDLKAFHIKFKKMVLNWHSFCIF